MNLLHTRRDDPAQLEVLGLIGRGSFGRVMKVRRVKDGKIMVRKEIPIGHMDLKGRTQQIAEFKILRLLEHPNIVQFIEHTYDGNNMLYLYMEYCENGDLQTIIKNYKHSNKYLPEGVIWDIFTQILLALYRCHYGVNGPQIENVHDPLDPPLSDSTQVIIHRDIKPENIFISEDGTFKLGDFGLAKLLNVEKEFATTCVGTPYYMSPEVLDDAPYSPLCDIWSLGCVIYELCTLHPPFQANTHLQLQKKIQTGIYPEIPAHYSDNLRIIIKQCLQVDPSQRVSTFELLQDINFKIQVKDLQLKRYETRLQKVENELYSREQEMNEELKYQQHLLKEEVEQIRINYQKEFQYVVEREVKSRLKQYNISTSTSPTRNIKPVTSEKSYSPSDLSMGMSPSPSSPPKSSRSPLQSLSGQNAKLRRHQLTSISSTSNNNATSDNILLTKNARLFENARVLNYDQDTGLRTLNRTL